MFANVLISIKWTALVFPAMAGLESMFGIFFMPRARFPFRMVVKVVVVALLQYMLWFYIHFEMLPYTGSGDLFMPEEFQVTLLNSTKYDVRAGSAVLLPFFRSSFRPSFSSTSLPPSLVHVHAYLAVACSSGRSPWCFFSRYACHDGSLAVVVRVCV
jgi:hypothetical protein